MTAPQIAAIEGYAAIFDRADLNGDVIAPGAFAKTLKSRTAPVRMLFAHGVETPIGRWRTLKEDARGLFVKGDILLSTDKGREVYALIAGGAIDGLSIGYQTIISQKAKGPAQRRITEAMLWEVSVVTFPMAPRARITGVGAPRLDPNPQPQFPEPHRASPLLPAGSARPARRAPGLALPIPRQAGVRHFAEALRGAASILSV